MTMLDSLAMLAIVRIGHAAAGASLGVAAADGSVARGGSSGPGEVLLWIGVLIVVTIAAGLLVKAIRRNMLGSDSEDEDEGTLMEKLAAMRDRGEISDQEYELTLRTMKARLKARLAADADRRVGRASPPKTRS